MQAGDAQADQFIERHVFRHGSKVLDGHSLYVDTLSAGRASNFVDDKLDNKGDLRRHNRTPVAALVELNWTDGRGMEKFITGQIIDVSESGMRIQLREPLARQTYVTLRADHIGLHGRASVRTCAKQGTKYVVGLEFAGGLKWKPKETK
jgi:PilZ domain